MRIFRYSRWDGTQTPITDDLSVSKLVDSLSDDILDGLGPDMAFEHMLRRGVPGQFGGIQSMMERLRRAPVAVCSLFNRRDRWRPSNANSKADATNAGDSSL